MERVDETDGAVSEFTGGDQATFLVLTLSWGNKHGPERCSEAGAEPEGGALNGPRGYPPERHASGRSLTTMTGTGEVWTTLSHTLPTINRRSLPLL